MFYSLFFGIPALITVAKNGLACNRIKEHGHNIKPASEGSVLNRMCYFVADYWFLAVPVVNVLFAYKILKKNIAEYENDRFNVLKDRGRIIELKKDVEENKKPNLIQSEKPVLKEDKLENQQIQTNIKKPLKTNNLQNQDINEKISLLEIRCKELKIKYYEAKKVNDTEKMIYYGNLHNSLYLEKTELIKSKGQSLTLKPRA